MKTFSFISPQTAFSIPSTGWSPVLYTQSGFFQISSLFFRKEGFLIRFESDTGFDAYRIQQGFYCSKTKNKYSGIHSIGLYICYTIPRPLQSIPLSGLEKRYSYLVALNLQSCAVLS